jgi:hypothetical protein
MRLSNMYRSEAKYSNHGINVVGPIAGFNVGLNDLLQMIACRAS